MKAFLRRSAAAAAFVACATSHAQGIPVHDAMSNLQLVQQVANALTMITNQLQQITQLQQQLASLNGFRNLGQVLNNPLLSNYVPAQAYTVVNTVATSGYDGLSTTAKGLRDTRMVYNCLDRVGTARTDCQGSLAQPYQYKALMQDAMRAASGRLAQINGLMDQINATQDQKAIQEIEARIGAENAMLSHEMSQIQMLQGLADSDERIARSRDRERQYEMLSRTAQLSDYLR